MSEPMIVDLVFEGGGVNYHPLKQAACNWRISSA